MYRPDRTAERRCPGGAIAVVACLAALALLAWQVQWLWPYVSDDAFISLRYAERFADGKGLTWNDGERVEGYSNLLWVLATSGLLRLGVDGLLAVRLLGAACAALAIAVVAFGLRPQKARDIPGALAAPLLLAASPPLAAWTCGGLEGPMVLLWSSCGLVLLLPAIAADGAPRGRCLLAGLPLALLCLTRPDAPLWVAATGVVAGLSWFLERGAAVALSRLSALALLPFVAVAGQLLFRLGYYGDWLPNTAHVKTGISRLSLQAGLHHVGGASAALGGVLLLALVGLLVALRRQRARALVLAVPIAVFYAYLIAVGGDHFVGWRMLFMVLAALALLGGLGLRALAESGAVATLLAALLALSLPALQLWLTRGDEQTSKARAEIWEWQGKALAELLGRAFAAPQPLLAVDGAGVMPYYSRLPSLDMLGLNDRSIARTPARALPGDRQFIPGHGHGNGAYVLQRQPDIVQFNSPPGTWQPGFVSGHELDADPGFRRDYRCVRLLLQAPVPPTWQPQPVEAFLWLRLLGRVGVRQAPGRVEVPATLLGSLRARASLRELYDRYQRDPAHPPAEGVAVFQWLHGSVAAVPHADGLGLSLRGREVAALDLPLGKGSWRTTVLPAAAAVEVALRDDQGQLLPRDGERWRWGGGELALEVRVPADAPLPQLLQQVVLTAD